MVRTGNVDFSCKRLTSIEIRKSKYRIIRRVRFRWDTPPPPPLRKISGSALEDGMNGIYLYFVNKHLSSWALSGL